MCYIVSDILKFEILKNGFKYNHTIEYMVKVTHRKEVTAFRRNFDHYFKAAFHHFLQASYHGLERTLLKRQKTDSVTI